MPAPPNWPNGVPYPDGPVYPDWVNNNNFTWGEDYNKTPVREWYPNGQYQWDDPYMNGDALKRNENYPRYGAYGEPDPNWRPSFFGETPPWQINPLDPESANRERGQWFGGPPANFHGATEADKARNKAQYDSNRAAKEAREKPRTDNNNAAYAAGARYVTDTKHQTFRAYYPPGYKGPRLKGASGQDMKTATPGEGNWVLNEEANSRMEASAPKANQSSLPPGPEPGVVPPSQGKPTEATGPAPAPQMSAEELEASRKGNAEYFDRYGNYNPDGYSSGPRMTQAEQQYWAQQKQVDPRVYQSTMYDPGDWAGQDTQRRMTTTRGPGGAARMSWNTQDPQYAALSAEQKSAGEAKMSAFNQQFDAGNQVNPADDKLYKVQQMSPQLRQTLMANQAQSTPAQKAAWAQWGDALTRFNSQQGGGQQPGTPAPMPGAMPPPTNMSPAPGPSQGAPQGAPQANVATQNIGDARFHNGNPYYNGKGQLRMPFRNAIASHMMNNDSGTSYNMGGQNGQALFGTANSYGYWPSGNSNQNMNMMGQNYGPTPAAAMNFYGGYGY